MKMEITILTLNIWRYYEWGKRKEKIIDILRKHNPEIILLQEVAYDERLEDKWDNQVEELNSDLKFPHHQFQKVVKMDKWHRDPINWTMYYGFGILSIFPIKHTKMVMLPPYEKKKKFGFIHIILETEEGELDLINVHFENTDRGSREHLKKTLDWCKKKEIHPIIAGDFNMKETETLKELANDYDVSYSIKPYKSFIPTEHSHDKVPVTLDYIISHKEKFKMEDVECVSNDFSDHNPIKTRIRTK